ncbi:DUF1206 domain-containing protein [Wolbachia endosymbiont of Trichogramma kaykai]|uniref:DUF1206 domain-containing protein n=1 Tax=Wolbachia endosymbiont of Trichogramma kaykai TaxID=444066 RepID=UPI003892ACB3
MSSTSLLAPLAVFAATPLGISVLAFVAVALVGLAIYSIIKNNKISEPKTPNIVIRSNKGDLFVKVKNEDFEYIKKHNQNKNQDGSVILDEYLIDFSLESNSYYITATSKEWITMMDYYGPKELIIRLVPSSIIKSPGIEQQEEERSLSN